MPTHPPNNEKHRAWRNAHTNTTPDNHLDMKTKSIFSPFACLAIITSATLILALPAESAPARPLLEGIEFITKKSGQPLSRGATEAMERAFAAHGDSALRVAREGGVDLAEAAAIHGDDVFSFAARVPESAKLFIHRSEHVLPLARQHGDDFLRLEAKVPGLADDAIRIYGNGADVRRLAQMPADQAKQVISYARQADSPETARFLLEAVERKGPGFLGKLDNKRILTLGLTATMITAASGLSITAGSEIVEGTTNFVANVWNWLKWLVLGSAFLITGYLCFKINAAFRLIPLKRKGHTNQIE